MTSGSGTDAKDANFSFRAGEAGKDPSANDDGQAATGGEGKELQKAVENAQADFKASKKQAEDGSLPDAPRPDD